jgi:hypothetical protein
LVVPLPLFPYPPLQPGLVSSLLLSCLIVCQTVSGNYIRFDEKSSQRIDQTSGSRGLSELFFDTKDFCHLQIKEPRTQLQCLSKIGICFDDRQLFLLRIPCLDPRKPMINHLLRVDPILLHPNDTTLNILQS